MICTYTYTFAQMSSSTADGFGDELKKSIRSQFGSCASKDGIDPYMAMNFTYSAKTIGYTIFGNSNFLRGYGTVGGGVTYSFLTNAKNIDNNFFGQITAGIGGDLYNKAEFEKNAAKDSQGKQLDNTGIGVLPSLNILLYGVTINNEEAGSFLVEGYFRAGKLSPPIGWIQLQYGLNKWLDASVYYSNDFGPMAGIVFNNTTCRLFLGGGTKNGNITGRLGFSISTF